MGKHLSRLSLTTVAYTKEKAFILSLEAWTESITTKEELTLSTIQQFQSLTHPKASTPSFLLVIIPAVSSTLKTGSQTYINLHLQLQFHLSFLNTSQHPSSLSKPPHCVDTSLTYPRRLLWVLSLPLPWLCPPSPPEPGRGSSWPGWTRGRAGRSWRRRRAGREGWGPGGAGSQAGPGPGAGAGVAPGADAENTQMIKIQKGQLLLFKLRP